MCRASSDNNKGKERNKQYTESETVASTQMRLTKVDGEQKALVLRSVGSRVRREGNR